jgi:hypothetical protein
MAKNGKKSGTKGKYGKRSKRAQSAPVVAPVRDLWRSGPAALAVAAGALVVAGITGLWRVRR